MKLDKITTQINIVLFLLLAILIRFTGVFIGKFENHEMVNRYFSYQKIANEELNDEVCAVIIVPEKTLQITKIYKKPIGFITNTSKNIIDSYGNLFKSSKNWENELIKVEGNYNLWPKYYIALQKMNLLDEIYQVKIYDYRIDIWLYPGILVQIGKRIEDLLEFKSAYPEFFKKGAIIDLRETKRVGISKFRNVK